jgi:hypothetical protein
VSTEDYKRSGRPRKQNDRKCLKKSILIHDDRRLTIHELAHTIGISFRVGQEIITENLNMRRFAPLSRKRDRPHDPENDRVCD